MRALGKPLNNSELHAALSEGVGCGDARREKGVALGHGTSVLLCGGQLCRVWKYNVRVHGSILATLQE